MRMCGGLEGGGVVGSMNNDLLMQLLDGSTICRHGKRGEEGTVFGGYLLVQTCLVEIPGS